MQNNEVELYLTGVNSNSVVKDNIFLNKTVQVTIPNDIKCVNNIGINNGDLIYDALVGVKLNKGVNSITDLPAPTMADDGRIIKVNSRYDDNTSSYVDTEYYICNRLANGSYKWCKLQLS